MPVELLVEGIGVAFERGKEQIALSRFEPGHGRLRGAHAGGDLRLGKSLCSSTGDQRGGKGPTPPGDTRQAGEDRWMSPFSIACGFTATHDHTADDISPTR
jgi:hypothetical protein